MRDNIPYTRQFNKSLSSLTDTVFTNLSIGDTITYTGSNWVNGVGGSGSGTGDTIQQGASLDTHLTTNIITFTEDATKTKEIINFSLYAYDAGSNFHKFEGDINVNTVGNDLQILKNTSNYTGSAWLDTPSISNAGSNIYLQSALNTTNYATITVSSNVLVIYLDTPTTFSFVDIGGSFLVSPDVYTTGDYYTQFDVVDGLGIKWRFRCNSVVKSASALTFSDITYVLYDVGGANESEEDVAYAFANWGYWFGGSNDMTDVEIGTGPSLNTIITYKSLGY